jgi:uncharacterized repeat protein (TIGR03806 family)
MKKIIALLLLFGCGGVSGQGTCPTIGCDTGLCHPSGGPRPDNQTCLAPPIPDSGAEFELVAAYPELLEDPFEPAPFAFVTKIIQPPGDPSRWFVLEKEGLMKVFDVADPSDIRVFLDFSNDMSFVQYGGGLLSLAFDPNFPTVPEIYVVYSSAANFTTLSRIILDDVDAPVAPVEQVILTLQKRGDGHYAGDIAFGQDGMLYMSTGEDFQFELAQQTTNLFGAMLRIDVSDVLWPFPAYNIPEGNAFPSTNLKCGPTKNNAADCPEIYAWGFRNPWRWSFDSVTGDLWLADVGEHVSEEVNVVVAGGNYGWPCFEGTEEGREYGAELCADISGMTPPVAEYTHEEGRAIIGGGVYRGSAMPERYGRYFFLDVWGSPVWELVPDGSGGYYKSSLLEGAGNVASTAMGADGEWYLAAYQDPSTGNFMRPPIMKLVPGEGAIEVGELIPDNLADMACFDPADTTLPGSSLIPYTVNSRLWSDGADKTRYMALPNSTTIDVVGQHDWQFPVGSVLVKNFYLDNKIIETRLLMNRLNLATNVGNWQGFTYEWDENLEVATRVKGGKTTVIADQQWTFPSETQCLLCHTESAGFVLGPETAQMNGLYHLPPVNQLEELDRIGMFTTPLPDPEVLPALVNPLDESADINDRARAYLHSNCANCHQPNTGVPSTMDLRYNTRLDITNACDFPPARGDLGIGPNARLIAPGAPENSVILERMSRRDHDQMPPLGSFIVDEDGVALMTEWIQQLELESCNDQCHP